MNPRTFLVGMTDVDMSGLNDYLEHTKQLSFMDDFQMFDREHSAIGICSFYAKLCYKSLTLGRNANVTAIRDIEDNIKGCIDQKHGAVFEHLTLNFVTTGCSRVFTHELVRHRVGVAYSQTSGRYCTVEDAELVLPPEFDELMPEAHTSTDTLRESFEFMLQHIKNFVKKTRKLLQVDDMEMKERKLWTSALRRIMPNGCDNEIGWSVNMRMLRHILELRTSIHAEWEIRRVMTDVARLIEERFPLMLYGGKKEVDTELDLDIWTKLRI